MSRRTKKQQEVVEVKKVVEEPQGDEREEVMKAFEYFDSNGKGQIPAKELKVILTKLGNPFTEQECKEIFSESNVDEDGMVSYEKFVEFWNEQ